jgi:hypothetical protein
MAWDPKSSDLLAVSNLVNVVYVVLGVWWCGLLSLSTKLRAE